MGAVKGQTAMGLVRAAASHEVDIDDMTCEARDCVSTTQHTNHLKIDTDPKTLLPHKSQNWPDPTNKREHTFQDQI